MRDLFDDYEAGEAGSRTSTPFLLERNGKLSLHFHASGVQSMMDLNEPEELLLGYTKTMMKFLVFNEEPKHIGMVGLGGGSLAKYCYEHLRQSRITVAEISPEVIALRNHFCIPSDDERFQVFCEDGADFVKGQANQFDVLIVDGFDSAGQPPQLCSHDFYQSCHSALTEAGILVVNICDSGRSMLVPRLRRSFDSRILVIDGENSTNTIVFASREGTELDGIRFFPGSKRTTYTMPCVAARPSFGKQLSTRMAARWSRSDGAVNFRPER